MRYKNNIKHKEEALFNISQAVRLEIEETEEMIESILREYGIRLTVLEWIDLANWCVNYLKKDLTYRLFKTYIICTELRREYNG